MNNKGFKVVLRWGKFVEVHGGGGLWRKNEEHNHVGCRNKVTRI